MQQCAGGMCQCTSTSCPNGCCVGTSCMTVDTMNDPNNCGMCGIVCDAGACSGGVCSQPDAGGAPDASDASDAATE
jgi:hypothetical protein